MTAVLQFAGLLEIISAYFTIQLVRCVCISFLLTGFIMLLRRFIFPNQIFIKGMLWAFLLPLPFLGRLKLYYENPAAAKISAWMMAAMKKYNWISFIYMAGVLTFIILMAAKRLRLGKAVAGMKKISLGQFRVRITDMNITPFTAGLISPEIVLPRIMTVHYSSEELNLVIEHEKTHIRLGHLWFYWAWDLVRCLLWPNPLLAVCQKYFRADMEDICDRVCIQNTGKNIQKYSLVLLKSLKLLNHPSKNMPSAAFCAGETGFSDMKKRLKKIAAYHPYSHKQCTALAVFLAAVLFIFFFCIHTGSYTRYSEDENILIYGFDGEKATFTDSSPSLRQMITFDDRCVYVDRAAFESFLRTKHAQGEIFIVFGGFYKLPGFGSGGYSCLYESDSGVQAVRIPYERPKENWMLQLFKIL